VIKKTSENGTLLILFEQENSKAPVYDLWPYADPLIRPEKIRTIIHNQMQKNFARPDKVFLWYLKFVLR